jgi:hypothetical protein
LKGSYGFYRFRNFGGAILRDIRQGAVPELWRGNFTVKVVSLESVSRRCSRREPRRFRGQCIAQGLSEGERPALHIGCHVMSRPHR